MQDPIAHVHRYLSPGELASLTPRTWAPPPAPTRPRYTVERRGSCTVIWLGRGEGRTMIAAFRGR
jgi:hypothetical protein